MSGIDVAIVLAFIVFSVGAGMRARARASRSLDEYYLAGRQVKGWRAGLSMAATQFAADSPLLFCGLIATAGVFALWRVWVYAFAFLLMGFLFAALWRRARVLTDAELVEIRYSGAARLPLRLAKAVYFGVVINSITLGFVLMAAFQVSEIFLVWHEWLPDAAYRVALELSRSTGLAPTTGASEHPPEFAAANNLISIVLLVGFVGLYSTTGGLRGVIASDLFQFGLAMAGSILFAAIVLEECGGLGGLAVRITEIYGEARARELLSLTPGAQAALAPFLVIVGLQWLFHMNSDGTGYLAQRFMACSADREARIAAFVFTWVQILARSLVWLIIGVGLLVLYPFPPAETADAAFAASRERTFLAGISDFMPAGARGLVIAALLAALASTLDTHLNWGSSYLTNDIYKRFVCEFWLKRQAANRELVLIARTTSILVLLGGCLVAANLRSIQQGWRLSLLFGAGIGAVLVLRWIWERINVQAEFAAMAIALVAGPALLLALPGDAMEWLRLGAMALVSTTGTVLVALVTRRTDDATLVAFYRQVRPPGFWRRTAALAGDDPAPPRGRLARVVLATIGCGASLVLLLAGAYKLLLRLPGDGHVAPVLLILASAALTPLWWGQLRNRPAAT